MKTSNDSNTPKKRPILTDGGMETTFIFREGIQLPEFASFTLLRDEDGREVLRNYYRTYLNIAEELDFDFVLESSTWRANPDWGRKLGYDATALDAANRLAIAELENLRQEYRFRIPEVRISGNLGPRGDGYSPGKLMTATEAERYHEDQIRSLADAGADFVSAFTLNYIDEAVGIVQAARKIGIPAVISFTVETDGCLPTGGTLREAIEQTDAATDGSTAYYMVNCAHPVHFEERLKGNDDWLGRIQGIRANASRRSHAELDACETLDDGDPADLAARLRRLRTLLPELRVFGGCCGTDDRHVRAIGHTLVDPVTEATF